MSTAFTHIFVDAWKQNYQGPVVLRDLNTTELPFVSLPWIAGSYTPAEQHSPEMTAALKISNELIAELKAADHIVIGTPMYNFTTPAILKAYIDQIVRLNETFNASYQGLVHGKKVTILIASGSDFSEGSQMAAYNVESGHLKQVFGFIGITDVNVVLTGGTSGIDQSKTSREAFMAQFTPAVVAAAK